MADQFEILVIQQMHDVFFAAGEKVVEHTPTSLPLVQQTLDQVGTNKSGSAGNQNTFHTLACLLWGSNESVLVPI